VADITRSDVTAFLKAKKRSAPGQARNLLGHLKCLFAWAINDGSYGLTGSPCHDIKAKLTIGAKRSGDRVLTDDELRAFWRATGRMRYPYGPLYRLLLLGGVRLNEAADASWPEFDFVTRRWTIRTASGITPIQPVGPQLRAPSTDRKNAPRHALLGLA
jgi:integrase